MCARSSLRGVSRWHQKRIAVPKPDVPHRWPVAKPCRALSFSLLHIQSNHQRCLPPHVASSPPLPPQLQLPLPPRPDGPPAAALATLPPRHFILSSVCLSLRYLVAAERHPHSESALTAAADPFACSFKCQVTTSSLERAKESQFNCFSSRV